MLIEIGSGTDVGEDMQTLVDIHEAKTQAHVDHLSLELDVVSEA